MYRFLRGLFPQPVADGLMVVWYVAIIILVILFFSFAPGQFRYINV